MRVKAPESSYRDAGREKCVLVGSTQPRTIVSWFRACKEKKIISMEQSNMVSKFVNTD